MSLVDRVEYTDSTLEFELPLSRRIEARLACRSRPFLPHIQHKISLSLSLFMLSQWQTTSLNTHTQTRTQTEWNDEKQTRGTTRTKDKIEDTNMYTTDITCLLLNCLIAYTSDSLFTNTKPKSATPNQHRLMQTENAVLLASF